MLCLIAMVNMKTQCFTIWLYSKVRFVKDLLRLYPIYTNNLKTFWQPYPVNAEDFLKASTYMTSSLAPENYIATQDNLGAYIEIKF